jgi:RNA polymerase sigma factor (TIGR02999 family)
MRLFGDSQIEWQDKSHFMIIASRQMRRILIDHARSAETAKRDKRAESTLSEDISLPISINPDLLALNEALKDLEKLHPRACQVVELRFFGGLTEEEAAKVLGVSVTTVKREWRFARAWLHERISGSNEDNPTQGNL